MSPGGSKSVYYYYRLLDRQIDEHISPTTVSGGITGVPPHFNLGSGAGFPKRPALALLFLFFAIFHGTLFWWTTLVDYPTCAVNLRGGRLGLSKATCDSEATRYAPVSTEALYPTLTTLRYYTPTTSPPSPTRDVFEDTKHGNMLNARNRAAPPRRLTATSAHKTQHASNDATLRNHWIHIAIFGLYGSHLGAYWAICSGVRAMRAPPAFTGIRLETYLSANTFARYTPGST